MTTDLSNRAVLKKLLFLTVGMFGFAYALVPMYNSACEAGLFIQQRVNPSELNTQVDSTRWITVEFVANVNEKMPWKFEPQQKSVKIHPGALTNVSYEVVNTTDRMIVGQAAPSYGPALAGKYFKKVQCFCFTKQTMNPGERREMPVVFVVDPSLPKDVNTITLSYTFFELGQSGKAAGGA
jgi:cytochrome c oxidase assembly protein subunit 11